ncbi:glycosyltransferase [Grimontia indica]|uniref:Glycosyltransferase n=1 Tax=Grimontia indica TaxID=1056512 RepID=R1ILL7_9GAMM|nr:glycosyltransferase family 2 protein [Grimontia indica]EOD81601.1 glycosyltransferase [Grimontia indica]
MKFSLVLCTIGRLKEVEDFLNSLLNQKVNYEIIIVDQNDSNELKERFEENFSFLCDRTTYLKVKEKGLSKSRNLGLKYASGDIVCFPDDDCIYSNDLLLRIEDYFLSNEVDVLSIKSVGNVEFLKNSEIKEQSKVTKCGIFSKIISYSMFFKAESIKNKRFDERLGVGSQFGSTEESDFLLSVINDGYSVKYIPDLKVYHPEKIEDYNNLERMKYYSLGVGAFYKKNMNANNLKIAPLMIKSFLGPLCAMVIFKVRRKKKEYSWYREMFISRASGFKNYEK